MHGQRGVTKTNLLRSQFPTTNNEVYRPNGPLIHVSHRRSPTRPSAKTSCLSLGALMPAWAAHRSNLSSPRRSPLFSDEVLLLSATASAFKHDWGGTYGTIVHTCSRCHVVHDRLSAELLQQRTAVVVGAEEQLKTTCTYRSFCYNCYRGPFQQ